MVAGARFLNYLHQSGVTSSRARNIVLVVNRSPLQYDRTMPKPESRVKCSPVIFDEELGPCTDIPPPSDPSQYRRRSDKYLRDRMDGGDRLAEREYARRRVRDFLCLHPDLPRSVHDFSVRLTYKYSALRMFVEIPLDRPIGDLKKALPVLRKWRQALCTYQGSDNFTRYLLMMKRLGSSYSTIAKKLNQELEESLYLYSFNKAQAETLGRKAPSERSLRQSAAWSFLRNFRYLLSSAGFTPAYIEGLIKDALRDKKEGDGKSPVHYIPWIVGEFRAHRHGKPYTHPITPQHVRAKLRRFKTP